ncbi:unnamed protein product [Phaedon cochleariae]|uniref:Uncharacterized protein n=1 Tax=Phaedon cochleariae TaxID=80249 RepID=A0A9N9X1B2_PHACE|nr:unnamed protein product [Phaedon cochleariae]
MLSICAGTANPVINPAAIRSSPNKSKQSTSNDSTTIPKTTKANTSKEPNKTAKLTDEQIDSLVNKYVVADDTQMSIDLCAGMSKNANDARLDQFGSSDDEPLSNLKKENVPKKRKRGAELVGQRKMKKYEELLLNKSLLKNNEFCVICFKYIPKIGQHIKQCHRRMPKDKIECKRCKKSFYYSSFLAVHKCIKE